MLDGDQFMKLFDMERNPPETPRHGVSTPAGKLQSACACREHLSDERVCSLPRAKNPTVPNPSEPLLSQVFSLFCQIPITTLLFFIIIIYLLYILYSILFIFIYLLFFIICIIIFFILEIFHYDLMGRRKKRKTKLIPD